MFGVDAEDAVVHLQLAQLLAFDAFRTASFMPAPCLSVTCVS